MPETLPSLQDGLLAPEVSMSSIDALLARPEKVRWVAVCSIKPHMLSVSCCLLSNSLSPLTPLCMPVGDQL